MTINSRVILVTGANKGIGFEVVRQLSRLGHTVILAARDAKKGLEAQERLKMENLKVHFQPLDVTRESDIAALVEATKVHFGKLDVVINNAAVLVKEDYSVAFDSPMIFQETYETNVMGPVKLVSQILSLIPEGGRIINTSSGGGSMSDPVGGWSPAYCISKSALNAFTRHLAHELQPKKIAVNAYCPGWVKTDMGGKSAPRSVEQGADTAVWLATSEMKTTGKFFRDRKVIPW